MGSWTIGYANKPSKADIEMMVTRELNTAGNGYYRHPLKMTTHLVKDGCWDYVTHAVCDVKDGEQTYTIVYTVLSYNDHGEIMGKVMDESVGPTYSEYCPATYLKCLTAPVNEYAREWREKVVKADELAKTKKIPLKDRKYKVGEEICTFNELVSKINAPLCMFERSKKMKGQVIGYCLVCNKVAFTRVE